MTSSNMNFFQRRDFLKKTNFLELTPIRIVQEEVDNNNIVTLLMPRFTGKFAQKYIVPKLKSPNIKLKLDKLGSATWLAIDGQMKVGVIANELVLQFGDKIQPVEERLTRFLSLFYQQKFITFKEIL